MSILKLSTLDLNIPFNLLLIIGGDESDLLPPSDPRCTSRSGNMSKRFFSLLLKYNIRFISSTALWGLALKQMTTRNVDYCWDSFIPDIFEDHSCFGLITAGKIVLEENVFKVDCVKEM
jgi:hypothetical protein